ncbi:MAG TPA: hypothetical protein VG406_28265 [Isosphaeraceae bacterium]|jgi:hypothetical protein|nr:hypothetical protein [Isosphaeraceae bacterium]
MHHFQVSVDPKLSVRNPAFGARVADQRLYVPERLARVLKTYALGDDPVTIAGFLVEFPGTVATDLGFEPSNAFKAAWELIQLLDRAGADVSSLRNHFDMPPLGSLHPALFREEPEY